MTSILRIQKLTPFAIVPTYQSELAAGFDLHAAIESPVEIKPLERVLIGTGLAMAIPPGFEGQVRPRSGLALKRGLTVLNSPGTIDADYRGEVKILLVNVSDLPARIEPGERIAQMVIAKCERVGFDVVATLDETARGAGGYGSTGH
jgi:dUTP pyrophosphatase